MTDKLPTSGSHSISIGRDAIGSQIVSGDHNVLSSSAQSIQPPAPESVDMRSVLAGLRELLLSLDTPDRRKIENALGDAEDELGRGEPDRDEIGRALDRALGYARKSQGFGALMGAIQPHLVGAARWLGQNWQSLLGVVGQSAAV